VSFEELLQAILRATNRNTISYARDGPRLIHLTAVRNNKPKTSIRLRLM